MLFDFVKYAFIGAATVVGVTLISSRLGRAKPKQRGAAIEVISISRIILGFLCLGSAALFVGSVYVAYLEGIQFWFLFVAGLGAIGLFSGGIQLFADLDIIWTTKGVEGPSLLFLGTPMPPKTKMGWNEIVKTGTTLFSHSWYLENATGVRIYFSFVYSGHSSLTEALSAKRPDLDIDWA